MEAKPKTNWPLWVGLALAGTTAFNAFDRPGIDQTGTLIWVGIMVALPTWGLIKFRHEGKIMMVCVLAFAMFITVAPGGDSGGCETSFEGHTIPITEC